jgi:hypothetical protein
MRSALRASAAIVLVSGTAMFGGTALAQAGATAQPQRTPRYVEGTDLPFAVSPPDVSQAKPAPAEPASRDELFGLKPAPGDAPAAAPAAAPATALPPVAASGFYAGTFAYTYSDPKHWSNAVNRFQFNLKGELAPNVRWTIGARADVDPVYMSDSFYLPAVQRDQRADFFWRETYLDFSAGDLDFRVGAQNIVWGDVVGFFVADVVSPRDLREFLLPSFDIIRAPQWAVRAEYFKGDSHLELVWIPYPSFDNVGKAGSDFYPVRLPSPTTAAQAAPFQNPDVPARTLGNSNYGIRGNTVISGWDLAAFYYKSFSRSPTFYTLPGGIVQPLYDRIWQAGGTVNKDLGEVVLHVEAVYTSGQSYASTDPTAPQGVLQRDTFDWVVGTDFTLPHNMRLNVQVFQRLYNHSDSTLVVQTGEWGASALFGAKITPEWEPQILWIQTFGGGGGLVRPRVNWYPAKNTALGFGVDVFTGPNDGFFGRYNNRDRVYVDLRYDF